MYAWEVITSKISGEKVEVHFAKVGGGCVFFAGVRFVERCEAVRFLRGAFSSER